MLAKKHKNNQISWTVSKPRRARGAAGFLVPSRRPVLLEALTAVNRAALCRLERNLVLLATVRTDDLRHLSGATVVSTAPLSVTQYFHSFFVNTSGIPGGRPLMLPCRCTLPLLKVCLDKKVTRGTHQRYTSCLVSSSSGFNHVKRITPSIPGLQPLSLGPTPQNLTGLYRNTHGASSLIIL